MTTRVYQRWPADLKARAEAEAKRRYMDLTTLTVEAVRRLLQEKTRRAIDTARN